MLHTSPSGEGVANSGNVTELAATVRSRTGQRTDVALVYAVVRSPEMAPLNAVVNVRDMTRVREVEEMRSTFLSMLGHQLQTPLAIIKGYTNTLSRPRRGMGRRDPAPQFRGYRGRNRPHEPADEPAAAASRLETGALPLNREQVNLAAVAEKVVGRMLPTSDQHEFSVSFPEDLPPVIGDPALLEETLVNLVDNAVKYSPAAAR